MDPLTHALAGGALARLALARPLGRAAWLPGVAAALLPDVDAAIRSAADPLLYAEYHRHFTHALAFIPVGGVVASIPWLVRKSTRPAWIAYVGAATAGYATHGPLDAATTYGTRLFWPFSDTRVALSWMAIVDPLFTALLLLGTALAVWRRSVRPVAIAVVLCVAYIAFGAAQRARALDVQSAVTAERGHQVTRADVFPAFGGNVIWRSLYEADGTLYMDRIRVPWVGMPSWRPGTTAERLDARAMAGALDNDDRRRDLRRFLHFTNGWAAAVPSRPEAVGDARYSMHADRYEPVWAIAFQPEPPRVAWLDRSGERRIDARELVNELLGRDRRYRRVE